MANRYVLKYCVVALTILASFGVATKNIDDWYEDLNEESVETIGPQCQELERIANPNGVSNHRISIFGRLRNLIILYAPEPPSVAAAALLAAGIRHGLGYGGVKLRPGPKTLCDLATKLPNLDEEDKHFDRLFIHVGVQSSSQYCEGLYKPCQDPYTFCTAAGSRLMEINQWAPPTSMMLHMKLSIHADPINCADAQSWLFFKNASAVETCGFKYEIPDLNNFTLANASFPTAACSSPTDKCVPILVPPEWTYSGESEYSTASIIAQFINKNRLPWRIVPVNSYSSLLQIVTNTDSSIIFADYDLWDNLSKTNATVYRIHINDLQSDTAVYVGDIEVIQAYSPLIYDVARNFTVTGTDLQHILSMEANGLRIEEAACKHSRENLGSFVQWAKRRNKSYWIYVFVCYGSEILDKRRSFFEIIGFHLMKLYENVDLQINKHNVNCSNAKEITRLMVDNEKTVYHKSLVGIVAPGIAAEAAADYIKMEETLMILYDTAPKAVKLSPTIRLANGAPVPLYSATAHFIKSNGWQRIAVISERSQISNDFFNYLDEDKDLHIGNRWLEGNTEGEIRGILEELREKRARVFFVNADVNRTELILCVATSLNLTPAAGYAWVVRDWGNTARHCNLSRDMQHFTVSYCWRGGNDSYLPEDARHIDSANIRKELDRNWPKILPQNAATIIDAAILLAGVISSAVRDNPHIRYDLHGHGIAKKLVKSLNTTDIPGVTQILRQTQYFVDEPLVFVDSWSGGEKEQIAVWRMQGNSVHVVHNIRDAYLNGAPGDGTTNCLHKSGDLFDPKCHDIIWIGVVLFGILLTIAAWLSRRARLTRLYERDKAFQVRLLARCERTASALAGHLVDRSALEIKHELGAGHFGIVSLGMLKLPGQAVVAVAVKTLREDAVPAEEAEFLREACALAALIHPHIVGLVGVCAADGPPLLLMEHAFFGDLRKYLHERRHLAQMGSNTDLKSGSKDAEADAVSPAELTRLACEAAAALAHLASMRCVHRDMRAANCLVDGRRKLKLADFGMARFTGPSPSKAISNEDDDYKYICTRRGLFPVPWMAPESLRDGVFSSASDVWALGVLILEITTLGAKPFGAWQKTQILCYVRDGGHAPLPRDASFYTYEILERCWRESPSARPPAGSVRDYFAARPQAVRPALRPAADDDGESHNPDSGFGDV